MPRVNPSPGGVAGSLVAQYAPPVGTVVVALGDSITGNGGGIGPQSGSPIITDSKAWFGWANALLGHCLTIYNAGKSGDTTAQILARFDTDVTPYSPRIVTVMGGTNDMLQSTASTTTIANLTAIYAKARALGATVVALPVPPSNNATGTQVNEALKVNRWIRDYCRANRGFVFVDTAAALYDTATTWQYLTGYTTDGTHPSALGASKMGQILAAALRPLVPVSSDLLGQSNSDPTNLLSNPMFNGSGTTIATGWSVSGGLGAVTVSYVARTDGVSSKRMQLAVPNGNATVNLQQNVSLSASLAVGDQCYFAFELELDTLDAAPSANTQDVRALLQCYNGSSFTTKAYDLYWDSTYVNVPFPGTSGVFCTPALTIPSGTALVQPVIQIQGGGNYRVSRAALRKGTP